MAGSFLQSMCQGWLFARPLFASVDHNFHFFWKTLCPELRLSMCHCMFLDLAGSICSKHGLVFCDSSLTHPSEFVNSVANPPDAAALWSSRIKQLPLWSKCIHSAQRSQGCVWWLSTKTECEYDGNYRHSNNFVYSLNKAGHYRCELHVTFLSLKQHSICVSEDVCPLSAALSSFMLPLWFVYTYNNNNYVGLS